MSDVLLFHRDFRCHSGGHGKVWNYFQHARAHPRWTPLVHMSAESIAEGNPWLATPSDIVAEWHPEQARALLLGGMDWTRYPADDPRRPVFNLVQGVRHADPALPLHGFLRRRAIRICVGQPVADAILGTGEVNGPVVVIEAALDLPVMAPPSERRGIFIDALKQPELGAALHAGLLALGLDCVLSTRRLPRRHYLASLAAASVAVLLPHEAEGFYLPGLEAMALGCSTVVPDCIGNRAYLEPGVNALAPEARVEQLVEAVVRIGADGGLARRLAEAGRRTAHRFDLARERSAFHALLDDVDRLW